MRIETYMQIAELCGNNSYCKRKQVGSVIVKDNRILSTGFNGTVRGAINECEDCNGETKQEVVHAEQNAIMNALTNGVDIADSILYVTLSPCIDCAKLIVTAKISKVVYKDTYKCTKGIEFLKKFIEVEELK